MKIKNFSDLGNIYSDIANEERSNVVVENNQNEVLLTDTTHYLNEELVKPGSAMGGGPGTKKVDGKDVSPLRPKSGPEGLKGNNFKKVDKLQDPGSDKATMKKEEEHEDNAETNEKEMDNAKLTTSEEKVGNSVHENNKYNYKPKFTMSKSKFDIYYEAAIQRAPFNENMEDEADDATLPTDQHEPMDATDAAADGAEDQVGGEEENFTHEEAIEACEKLLAFLKKDKEVDTAHGDLGDEDQEIAGSTEEEEEDTIAEDVDAEDEGHVLTKANGSLKKGNPDAVSKPVVVGSKGAAKTTGAGKAVDGKLRNEPEPKEVEGDESALHGNKNKLQNTKKFTAGATKEPKVGEDLFG